MMRHRQPVLVAIDDASDVERTFDVARSVARTRGADVHVIEVVPRRAVRSGDRLVGSSFEYHDQRAAGIEARLASRLRSGGDDGVRVRRVTLHGAPEHVIPAHAQLHEATLLIVERDYGGGRFWRTGRVVDDLARRSPIPLLVLPKRQRPARDERVLHRILTPVDFSIASAVALRTAVDLSRRHDARVTLVHSLEGVPRHMVFSGSEAANVARRLPAQLGAAADRLRRRAAFFGMDDVDTEVATGNADGAILEIATRTDADLIVMGIAHRSRIDRMVFGTTLRRVLRRATVPVLVVPVVAGAHEWSSELADQISSREWTQPSAGRAAA